MGRSYSKLSIADVLKPIKIFFLATAKYKDRISAHVTAPSILDFMKPHSAISGERRCPAEWLLWFALEWTWSICCHYLSLRVKGVSLSQWLIYSWRDDCVFFILYDCILLAVLYKYIFYSHLKVPDLSLPPACTVCIKGLMPPLIGSSEALEVRRTPRLLVLAPLRECSLVEGLSRLEHNDSDSVEDVGPLR